ncbi:5-formyltetrahydrofolate cyclo-ligase [Kiritimatiella glycovorans]|uniref:5-formyltetrahydrofolate cyclo-ligase n=1 Tax=Kiritimatiella glycovorans TaxID=1307763 RepID=A0A0G3EJR8_9BACT|nr:5-formyltetrahydrofolate cyclo-ligase [Kiritimatiella glycovorans]AKJ65692.1 5-formyltetrahydrofolate cyclo-ligase family protein [Kiritimatiella glycovorans]
MNRLAKDKARRWGRAGRASLPPDARARKNRALCRRLTRLKPFITARSVALYRAVGDEVDLSEVEAPLRARGVRIYLPRYNGEQYEMALWQPDTPLERGPLGIPQPPGPAAGEHEIDLVLVPGLAFDVQGNRAGHGGGHYDRMLKNLRAFRTGVAFDAQLVPRIETAPHDVPVRLVLTERRLYGINAERFSILSVERGG